MAVDVQCSMLTQTFVIFVDVCDTVYTEEKLLAENRSEKKMNQTQ